MRRAREHGVALVAVMMVMLLMMGLAAALHSATIGETSLRGAHARTTAGFYAAESGINRGMGEYRDMFLAFQIPQGADFNSHSFTLGARNVSYQLTSVPCQPTVAHACGANDGCQITVPAGKPFAGLNATECRYTASGTSQLTSGDTEASLGNEFDVDSVPLFQFLAFYQNDLEIEPGANMTLHGPIFTNSNLYLNSDATLTILDCYPNQPQAGQNYCPTAIPDIHVYAAKDIIRGRKDANTCAGTVQIAKLVDSNHNGLLDLQSMACGGTQTNAQLSGWLGAVKNKQQSVSPPAPDIIVRGGGSLWNEADLRIVLDFTTTDGTNHHPIVVQTAAGATDNAATALLQNFMAAKPGRIFYNDVPTAGNLNTTSCGTVHSYCNHSSYTPIFADEGHVYPCVPTDLNLFGGCAAYMAAADQRRGGFYSNREGAYVAMLNLNLHDLLAWNRLQAAGNQLFNPDNTTNGGNVIFLSVKNGNAAITNPRLGVRIFGSPNLDFPGPITDPTGVTVVSDVAAYLEGNYNIGDGATPALGPHPKQPAAIMGDTINVLSAWWSGVPHNPASCDSLTCLSSCWNDCQSRQSMCCRKANPTTVYSAFLAGVDTTTNGNYNGGFENYPRFHEDWSGGQALGYRGSFASLGSPVHNNGAWCGTGGSSSSGCNMYNPPVRNWDYDTDFQQFQNLPPATPLFVSVQQILFTENFR
jgi:hypothetical protein